MFMREKTILIVIAFDYEIWLFILILYNIIIKKTKYIKNSVIGNAAIQGFLLVYVPRHNVSCCGFEDQLLPIKNVKKPKSKLTCSV